MMSFLMQKNWYTSKQTALIRKKMFISSTENFSPWSFFFFFFVVYWSFNKLLTFSINLLTFHYWYYFWDLNFEIGYHIFLAELFFFLRKLNSYIGVICSQVKNCCLKVNIIYIKNWNEDFFYHTDKFIKY